MSSKNLTKISKIPVGGGRTSARVPKPSKMPELRDQKTFFQRFENLHKEHLQELGHMVFMDERKKKEWEELPDNEKSFVMKHLSETCSRMEAKRAIDMLCHVINDLISRIQKLEAEK